MSGFHYSGAIRDEEIADVVRALCEAFGGEPERRTERVTRWRDNWRVLRDDAGRMISSLHAIPMGQYFGGRSVPMVGIASVATPPEFRGGGGATVMMEECIRELAGRGVPISTLFASTQRLYRKVGYELAGHRFKWTIPLAELPRERGPGRIRRAAESDRAGIESCYREFARSRDGSLDRGPFVWSWLGHDGAGCFVVEDAGEIVAYVESEQVRVPGSSRRRLCMEDCFASTPEGWLTIWRFWTGFASMCDTVETYAGPCEPEFLAILEQRYRVELSEHWMVRLTSLPGAIEARGYPGHVAGSLDARVVDPLVPENDGVWSLSFADGRASCQRSEASPDAEIPIGQFAPIYTGFCSARSMRDTGRIRGDDDAIALLDAAFAGPAPSMGDMF